MHWLYHLSYYSSLIYNYSLIHLYLFPQIFIYSFTWNHTLIHSLIHLLINFFIYSLLHWFIYLLIYFINSLFHSPSLILSFIHSLSIHSFLHALAHSVPHSHLFLPVPQHSILPGSRACIMVRSISPQSQNIPFHFNFQLAELCRHVSWCAEDMLSTQEQMFL